MLKWSGDYTLPRFRAKLAEKYNLHPDVEPGYEELYRPDLGATVVTRKGYVVPGMASTWSGPGGFYKASMSASTGNLRRADMFANSMESFASTGGSAQFRRTAGSQMGDKELRMSRNLSVPSLGSRRLDRAPACLQPIPADLLSSGPLQGMVSSKGFSNKSRLGSVPGSPVGSPTAGMMAPMSPSAEDKKELEKEKQSENASRRLWSTVGASEIAIKNELNRMLQEAPPEAPLKEAQQIKQLGKLQIESIQMIMKQGAKLEWRNEDWDGATLLLKAVRTNSVELTKFLLGKGADVTCADNLGRGVLHWAAIQGNPEMVTLFLENCPDLMISEADLGGDSPLHLAAYHGHLVVVRLLVRKGADPAYENGGGFTPQQLAESRRMWPVVSYLAHYRHQQLDNAPNAYGFDDSSALVQQVSRVLQTRHQQHPDFTGLKDLLRLMREHKEDQESERHELAHELARVMRLMKADDVDKDHVWSGLARRLKGASQEDPAKKA